MKHLCQLELKHFYEYISRVTNSKPNVHVLRVSDVVMPAGLKFHFYGRKQLVVKNLLAATGSAPEGYESWTISKKKQFTVLLEPRSTW